MTIKKFLDDEFALKGVMPIEVINDDGCLEELDINGLKFSELPEYIQNAIKDCNIKIWHLNNADQEQVARNFCNLNNGKTMDAATLCRIKAKSKEQIGRLGAHKMFEEALSETAMKGHVNESLVARAHAILYDPEVSLLTTWIRKYMRNTEITEEDERVLNEVFDRIRNIHAMIEDNKIAKRIYAKTHIISIVPIISKSIEDKRSDTEMMEWFVTFFSGKKSATTSKSYNNAAGSGSGKNTAVKTRLNEIKKSYEGYFAKVTTLAS